VTHGLNPVYLTIEPVPKASVKITSVSLDQTSYTRSKGYEVSDELEVFAKSCMFGILNPIVIIRMAF
jgi:hypothetical protein